MIEKIKQFIVNLLTKSNGNQKLSLTQTLFKYVVFLCIGIVSLDLIVPMILKWMVIKGEIDLIKLGLDPSKFFRIVPSEAYNFLNFFFLFCSNKNIARSEWESSHTRFARWTGYACKLLGDLVRPMCGRDARP